MQGKCTNDDCKYKHDLKKFQQEKQKSAEKPSQKNEKGGMQTQLHSLTKNMAMMMTEIKEINKKIEKKQ